MDDGILTSKVNEKEEIAYVAIGIREILLTNPDTEKVFGIPCLSEFGVGEIEINIFL